MKFKFKKFNIFFLFVPEMNFDMKFCYKNDQIYKIFILFLGEYRKIILILFSTERKI